jgi:NAD(P)-dependent dehydrogenase (short-subunit alcohol dehydrogenase family)
LQKQSLLFWLEKEPIKLKILVTGGAGFIGSTIVDHYIQAGHSVWVVDNESSGRRKQINSKATPSSEDVNKAVATLDKQSPEPGKENPAAAKSLKENAKQKIEKTANSDIQEKLKEFSELIAIEKQKLESESATSVVKQRNSKQEDVLIKRIEQITGKSFETLILKSGKKVRGVIFLENNIYYVVTPEGQETYKEEEADGIEL